MRKLLFILTIGSLLVGCYPESELNEHRDAYKELSAQVKADAEARIAAIQADLDDALAEVASLDATLVSVNAELDATYQSVELKDAIISELNLTIESLLAEIDVLNAELDDTLASLNNANADLAATNLTIDGLRSEISSLNAEVQRLNSLDPEVIIEQIVTENTVYVNVEAQGSWIPVLTNNVDGSSITRYVNQDYPGWSFDIQERFGGLLFQWNAVQEDEFGTSIASSSGNAYSADDAFAAAIAFMEGN